MSILRVTQHLYIHAMAGTGKSLTASEVCSRTEMRHIDVGQIAKQQKLYNGFDDQYQCPILDEDKVHITVSLSLCISVMLGNR